MRQLGGQRKMEDLTEYGLGTTFSFARVNREPVNSKLRYIYIKIYLYYGEKKLWKLPSFGSGSIATLTAVSKMKFNTI